LIAPFDMFYHQEVNLTYHYVTGVPEIKLYLGYVLWLITGILTWICYVDLLVSITS